MYWHPWVKIPIQAEQKKSIYTHSHKIFAISFSSVTARFNAIPFLENRPLNTVFKISGFCDLPVLFAFADSSCLRQSTQEKIRMTASYNKTKGNSYQGLNSCLVWVGMQDQGLNSKPSFLVFTQKLLLEPNFKTHSRCKS